MSTIEYRAAIIGCGRMGQQYAKAYTTYPGAEIVAIAERCKVVGTLQGMCSLSRGRKFSPRSSTEHHSYRNTDKVYESDRDCVC